MKPGTTETLDELSREIHDLAVSKGWWDKPVDDDTAQCVLIALSELLQVSKKLRSFRNGGKLSGTDTFRDHKSLLAGWQLQLLRVAVMISDEVVEFCEAVLSNSDTTAEEAADIVIRGLDLIGAYSVNPGMNIAAKHAYNKTRPHRHGGKRL